jgi:hypothetical protein
LWKEHGSLLHEGWQFDQKSFLAALPAPFRGSPDAGPCPARITALNLNAFMLLGVLRVIVLSF